MVKYKLDLLNKLENIGSLLFNFFQQKNIIVLIGSKGTFLIAIDGSKIIDNLFIPLQNQLNIEQYKTFFTKYKKFCIFFLLDQANCSLRHEIVPVLQSVMKVNPVTNFINSYFSKSDIVAYNVYSITEKFSETWNILLASVPYQEPLSTIIEYIIANSLKFGGSYFLSLELKTIIDKILQQTAHFECVNHLQIFACILDASNIKFVVKHLGNIIFTKTIEYPIDKSDLYIQGIMEQEVEDLLISSRSYISHLGLGVTIIFLVSENLRNLLQQSNFADHKIIIVTDQDVIGSGSIKGKFSDAAITCLFSKQRTFIAVNAAIKSIMRLNMINFLVFKPLMIGIFALILTLGSIKFDIFQNKQKAHALNKQYYQIASAYRDTKQQYPNISNIANLADLYSLEALLQMPLPTPFNVIEKFLATLNEQTHLNKINWELQNINNLTLNGPTMKMDISLKFITIDSSLQEAMVSLKEYINDLKKSFGTFEVNYVINEEEITDIYKKLVIPFSISIVAHPRKS